MLYWFNPGVNYLVDDRDVPGFLAMKDSTGGDLFAACQDGID